MTEQFCSQCGKTLLRSASSCDKHRPEALVYMHEMKRWLAQAEATFIDCGDRGFDGNEIEEAMGALDELQGSAKWLYENFEAACGDRMAQAAAEWRETEVEQRAERAAERREQLEQKR